MAETWAVARLVVPESLRSFVRNDGTQTAATLAYYGAFALVPLLLLLLIVTSRVMFASEAAVAGLEDILSRGAPRFADAVLKDARALSQGHAWGAVSIVLLLWAITPFAAAIRRSFLRVFRTEQRLPFLKAKLVDVSAALSLLALLLFLVAARVAYSIAEKRVLGHLGLLKPLLGTVAPLLAATLVLAFLYRAFAPGRPGRGSVLAAAVTTALLLALIRPAFELMLRFNPDYGFAFGSMKAVFLLMVWVYYSFAVLLLGAEVMANLERRDALLLRGLLSGAGGPDPGLSPLLRRFVTEYRPGTILFREEDPGREMHCVLSGAVTLTRAGETLSVMRAGSYFGEMSMLTGAPRTATATVSAPGTRLVAISQDNFEVILRENPAIVRAILVEMAARLGRADELVGSASDGAARSDAP
ncbi:MAG: YihY family inner membrane protein [Armatimonadetes bacterium]|nr:YihY family inner membrane protein [Armatimonadota bacterium]